MLERLALATTPDQFAERRQFRFRQGPFELEIKFDPFALERVREQMLRIQPRALDVTLLEVSGGRLKNFQNGHVVSCQSIGQCGIHEPRARRASCSFESRRRPLPASLCARPAIATRKLCGRGRNCEQAAATRDWRAIAAAFSLMRSPNVPSVLPTALQTRENVTGALPSAQRSGGQRGFLQPLLQIRCLERLDHLLQVALHEPVEIVER